MSILIDRQKRIFSLNTRNTTYQLLADTHGYLRIFITDAELMRLI
jgi:hypothetical protein